MQRNTQDFSTLDEQDDYLVVLGTSSNLNFAFVPIRSICQMWRTIRELKDDFAVNISEKHNFSTVCERSPQKLHVKIS